LWLNAVGVHPPIRRNGRDSYSPEVLPQGAEGIYVAVKIGEPKVV